MDLPEGRPKIAQRFIAGLRAGSPEVPVGTKELPLGWLLAGIISVVPPGLSRSRPLQPSDESLGYFLSPFGLTRISFHQTGGGEVRGTTLRRDGLPLVGRAALRAAKVLGASEFINSDGRQKKLATAMGLNLVTF
jgi:hypothetical protein